jgi:molybdopterin molybdotransferase
MISVPEARSIIAAEIRPLSPVLVPLERANGLRTTEDIISPISIPGFAQSAMDGYALHWEGWQQHRSLRIIGEIAAGDAHLPAIAPHECVRIFTGAPVPPGADTVIQKELIRVDQNTLWIDKPDLTPGTNVRRVGSEIARGALAMPAGTLLVPGGVGFVASLGLAGVMAIPKPSCAVIVTGNELQKPGFPLSAGQVYESNSFALSAALRSVGVEQVHVTFVQDTLAGVTQALETALATHPLVLLTGGISAGDYDFVLPATQACGVRQHFHKIKQKPGKPLFFGTQNQRVVFGLPGNPASVMTCFYQYVVPAIHYLSGTNAPPVHTAPIQTAYQKPAGLTHFLKADYNGQTVRLLGAQESFRMSSFAQANCMVTIPEEITQVQEGDLVEIVVL